MDYAYAKFGDCIFIRFGFIMRTDRQTESYTDADDRLTQSTTVGVSNLIKQSTTQIATLLTSISSFAVYSLVLCSFLRALVQLSDFLCNEL